MLESLIATSMFGTGTASAYPTANSSLHAVEKRAKRNDPTCTYEATPVQSGIAATLTSSITTGSAAIGTQSHLEGVLQNSQAYVQSLSDEELQEALIAIGELEAEIETKEVKITK